MLPEVPAMGTNPLNEDPPSSIEQFAGGFNVSVNQYNVDVEAYQQALSEVEEVNELGDQIVNLVSEDEQAGQASWTLLHTQCFKHYA